MNKGELVEAVAGTTGSPRGQVELVLNETLRHIVSAVSKGDKVTLTRFGTFERRERGARTARNPRTGAPIKVKASKAPAFKAGAEFRNTVSGAKKASPAKRAAPAKQAAPADKAPAKKR